MKKIYSFVLAAVAILSAASCQKEMANAPEVENGEKFTVVATAAETKTVLDGVNTYWTPGDQIALYDVNGAEVTFSTDITETAAKAVFTAESEFVPNADGLLAVYPKRIDRGATSYANGVVTGLHIGGTQQAVAGSFDPKFAVALGIALTEESNDLLFVNVHSLVKFTVGGETAPAKVTLKNNGERMIAGMYNVDINTGEATVTAGAGEITLDGPFEVGKTYYIALTHGVCGNGISLYYDDVEMKNTGETITLEPNMIYNLGTLPAAEEPEQPEEPVDPADPWATAATAVDGDEGMLKELKAYADAEFLHIRLTAAVSQATYLDIFLNDGEGETATWWGWTTTGTDVYNIGLQEHKGDIDPATGEIVKMRFMHNGEKMYLETPVTEKTADSVIWYMDYPIEYIEPYKSSTGKVYVSFLLWQDWDPYWAIPARGTAMLEVAL